MKKESKLLVLAFAIFLLFASNICTYIITSAKYVDKIEMLKKDNIRLTDDFWVLHSKLQKQTPD